MSDVVVAIVYVLAMVPVGNLVDMARFIAVITTAKRRSLDKV